MDREYIVNKFDSLYQNILIIESIDKRELYDDKDKIIIKCLKCKHTWPSSIKNVLVFRSGCYECCRGKGYSMDEMKILNYIKDHYIPKEHHFSFRHAEHGSQLIIRPAEPKNIPGFRPPLYYSCDGYSRFTYEYNKEEKKLQLVREACKGTVFEVLGDYHHSNPWYYKPHDISPRKGMTHKENYEYTINRMKHIEEQGFKVFYIWITDFRRYTRDLEKGLNPCFFDYVNQEKKQTNKRPDYSLLSKGTQRIFARSSFSALE